MQAKSSTTDQYIDLSKRVHCSRDQLTSERLVRQIAGSGQYLVHQRYVKEYVAEEHVFAQIGSTLQ